MRYLRWFLILCFAVSLEATYLSNRSLTTAAFNVNAGVTATDGSGYTATVVNVKSKPEYCRVYFKFNNGGAGAANTLQFTLGVSYDGTNFETTSDLFFEIATNADADGSNNVIKSYRIALEGAKDIKLIKVYNSDGVNNVTAVTVNIVFPRF